MLKAVTTDSVLDDISLDAPWALVETFSKMPRWKPQDVNAGADVIAGFPGETESDYKATRDLVEQLQFDNGFIFRYSPRRETPAAAMLDQIDESVKEARNQDLLGIINASARCANERLVGTHVEVLCEGPSKTNPARLMGRTGTNKVVVFEAGENRIGKIFDVAIERANGFSLYGQPID